MNRKQSDIVLKNKSLKIAVDPKVNGYQRSLVAMVYELKVHSSFKNNIWGVDLAYMSLISKFIKRIKYLLCVTDLFSRFAWVIVLKNKKGDSIVEGFKKILSSGRKPNKIWVDHGSEFYNNKFKSCLKKMTLKCIQNIMKKIQLLPKDLSRL